MAASSSSVYSDAMIYASGSRPDMKPKAGAETLFEAPSPCCRPHEPRPNEVPGDAASGKTAKKILVPVDFSDGSLKALAHASTMAQQAGAVMVLLHVVEPALHPGSYLAAASELDDTTENLLEANRRRLASVGRKHVGHHVSSELLVRMGRAHSEILDTAQALGADLIVIGTRGEGGSKSVELGSTAERVLRHASCRVLTVPTSG